MLPDVVSGASKVLVFFIIFQASLYKLRKLLQENVIAIKIKQLLFKGLEIKSEIKSRNNQIIWFCNQFKTRSFFGEMSL